MLESFRKYTWLMFGVLILVFVGLVFFGAGSGQGIGGKKVVTAHGQGFTQRQSDHFAQRPNRLIQRLFQSGRANQAMVMYSQVLGSNELEYLVNRLSLQKGIEDFGLHASKEEAEEFSPATATLKSCLISRESREDFQKSS